MLLLPLFFWREQDQVYIKQQILNFKQQALLKIQDFKQKIYLIMLSEYRY